MVLCATDRHNRCDRKQLHHARPLDFLLSSHWPPQQRTGRREHWLADLTCTDDPNLNLACTYCLRVGCGRSEHPATSTGAEGQRQWMASRASTSAYTTKSADEPKSPRANVVWPAPAAPPPGGARFTGRFSDVSRNVRPTDSRAFRGPERVIRHGGHYRVMGL